MKIVLSTLNAKFIHSSLALAYLQSFCQSSLWDIEVKEYTINERKQDIMADIFLSKPDILCFSCYIWNIDDILTICADYKKVSPHTIIILGGPEVSYDSTDILETNKAIDIIIRGEGELTLNHLLQTFHNSGSLENITGITYREGIQILANPDRELIKDLDMIPNPYLHKLNSYTNKIIYYETSRGCPFNCAYCLSSTIKGVRFFSLERVKNDLRYFIEQGVREVKFVDRTFNCNERRAREIMEFIIEQNGNTRFHFEIGAELLTDEMLSFLATVPDGIFDFEIGIQSTCKEALNAVNRVSNWKKLSSTINRLIIKGNIHIHLDLIAGLPYEDYARFAKSFNDVYNLSPDVIQLGFLKLLKGSSIRELSHIHHYIFEQEPPYQVLQNKYISYEELIKLSEIEDLLERYYNSGYMKNSLDYIVQNIYAKDAFCFFEHLANFWHENGLFAIGHKKEAEYSILSDFIKISHSDNLNFINELIKYDYLLNNKSYIIPTGIKSNNPEDVNDILYSVLKNENFIHRYLGEWAKETPREMRKKLHLEYLSAKVIYPDNTKDEIIPILFVYNPLKRKATRTIDLTELI